MSIMNSGVTDGRIMITTAVRPCPKIRLAVPYPSGMRSDAMSILRTLSTTIRAGRLVFLNNAYGTAIIK